MTQPIRPVYFWMPIKCGFGFQFYSNLILIEVDLQIATVSELPAPAFASTPQRTMMTKRIENPAAVHGRQNQAEPWQPAGTSSRLLPRPRDYVAAKFYGLLDLTARARQSVATAACSSARFAFGVPPVRICTDSADEQELVPTGCPRPRTENGEP
jgi:hypothetical protein